MNLKTVPPTEDVKEIGRRAVLFRTCTCITSQKHLPRRPTGVEISVILPLFMWDVGTSASQRGLVGCRKTNLLKIPPEKAWKMFFLFTLPHTLFGERLPSILPGYNGLYILSIRCCKYLSYLQNYLSSCRNIGHFQLTKIDWILKAPFQ